MNKKIIKTKNAPKAVGPYEQGVKAGNLIFTSGQIPIDPETGEILTGNISQETKRVILNLKTVLEAGGSSLSDTIKVTIFLTDIKDFEKINAVYEQYFKDSKPARSCVEVSALPKGVSIEMEAIGIAQNE